MTAQPWNYFKTAWQAMEVPNLYLVIKKITSLKFNMDIEILL